MKNSLLPSVLVAGAVGCVAAVLTTFATAPASEGRATAAMPAAGFDAAKASGTDEALEELERENEVLRLRVATLETAVRRLEEAEPSTSRAPVAAEVEREEAELDQAMREFMRAYSSDGRVPELFVLRVNEAMEEIRAAEDAERDEAQRVAQAERIERQLNRLGENLGLSRYQVDEMREILIAQETARSAMWAGLREGAGDRSQVREQMRATRDEANARIAEVLDPDQYERYRASEGGRGFGGLGGLGRRDDGGVQTPSNGRTESAPTPSSVRRGDG